MAVTTQEGDQYAAVFTTKPATMQNTSTWDGRVRCLYVSHTQSGAGDATSIVSLCKLPAGTVRLLLPMSWLYVNWTTASATIDLGWAAYTDLAGDAVTADVDGLVDGLSVESADVIGFEELTTLAGLAATGYTKVFSSQSGVTITASSTDTAIAASDTIVGCLFYVLD